MRILSVFDEVLRGYVKQRIVNIVTSISLHFRTAMHGYPLPEQLQQAQIVAILSRRQTFYSKT